MNGSAPFLTAWFELLDGDEPTRILDLISADFSFSILFSTGGDTAIDFHGGRDALVDYLEQRERGTRTHHPLATGTIGTDEFYLGEVRRGSAAEASYVATGRLNAAGQLCRLLIGRSPEIRFG